MTNQFQDARLRLESPKLSLVQSLDQQTCSSLNGLLELETWFQEFKHATGSNAGGYVKLPPRILFCCETTTF
jgi:hypothetical protein